MSEDKAKQLNLMRFWLFGTFVILWAISLTYMFIYLAPISDVATVLRTVWPVWVVAAVGAIVLYLGYKWWLGRSEDETPAPAMPESGSPPPPEPPSYSQPGKGGSEG